MMMDRTDGPDESGSDRKAEIDAHRKYAVTRRSVPALIVSEAGHEHLARK